MSENKNRRLGYAIALGLAFGAGAALGSAFGGMASWTGIAWTGMGTAIGIALALAAEAALRQQGDHSVFP